MKLSNRKNWKASVFAASIMAATAAAGYTSVSANNTESIEQVTTTPAAPTASTTPTKTATTKTTTSTVPQQPGTFPGGTGKRGRGGHGGELQGLDTNPPVVELAPAQSEVEATQSTELVEGAQYYDGEYYGDAVRAGRWGTMQVVAVIENGELTDVRIASYPHSTYESDIITRNALPTLISEAIEAQDAKIDMVSRATDSSDAFIQSLDSALLDAAIGVDL
jgi:uncharacterized protein with FMN-binding domain